MNSRKLCASLACLALAGAAVGAMSLSAQQQPAVVGDAERGQPLFADTFNCYACHGFDAQTGERRLVPMNFPQEAFILFVQNSPLPQMPAYPDVSAQDLADIYAYIRSIPVDAPAFADVPLLNAIRDRKKTALGN